MPFKPMNMKPLTLRVRVQVTSKWDTSLYRKVTAAFLNSECGVMNATGFLANKTWLEGNLRASETFTSKCDDVSIKQFTGLFLVRALTCILHLSVKVQSDVAKFFIHIAYNFTFGGGSENLHQVLSQSPM